MRPQTLWSTSAGGGGDKYFTELAPNVQIDAVYAADLDGRVYAFSTETGKRLWTASTKSRVAAGPSVADDLVLVASLDAEAIALKRADGSLVWRAPLSSEGLAAPVAQGKVVVARSVDGRVFGLSAADGHRLWSFDRIVPDLVLRGMSQPLIVGRTVILGMENGRLVGLNLDDGQPKWEQAISVPAGRTALDRIVDIDASPIEGDECVYVASYGGDIACLDADSGDIAWRRTVKAYNTMTLAGDKLIISDESGVVWALDAHSGAQAWKQESLLYRKLSAPAFFRGYIVVGDFEGYLHWIDPADGKVVARSQVGSDAITAQPVATDTRLYVLGSHGRLAAIGLPDKK